MTDAIFLFQLEKPYVSNFECENTIFDTICTIKRNYASKNLQIHRPLNPEASQSSSLHIYDFLFATSEVE